MTINDIHLLCGVVTPIENRHTLVEFQRKWTHIIVDYKQNEKKLVQSMNFDPTYSPCSGFICSIQIHDCPKLIKICNVL